MSNSHDSNRAAVVADSSQILVEVQLKLIYYLETVLAFVRARTAAALTEVGKKVNVYFADSFLYSAIFKCKTYFLNNTVRRRRLLEWLHDKLRPPFTPTNFNVDWADGIRLCALCEVISPGACPRYDLLSPANAQSNIKLALSLVQAYLNVKPSITVKEIYECSSEANLVHLLSQIKISYAKKVIKSTGASWLKLPNNGANAAPGHLLPPFAPFSEFYFSRCFVKGMGLVSGVRSRRSRFSLYYYEPLPKISLIFEIVGPNGSFCSEKVVAEFEPGMNSLNSGDDELSLDYDDDELQREKQLELERKSEDYVQAVVTRAAMQKRAVPGVNMKIPFFYKIFADHILITYIPLFTGDHVISIIWQGQHVLNSPYTVSIEESEYLEGEVQDINPKFEPGYQYPLCLLPEYADRSIDEMGTVVRTKVLKRSIIAGGKEYDYDSYFEKNYSPNFLKYPNDSRILDPKIQDSSSYVDETDAAALSKLIRSNSVSSAPPPHSTSSSSSTSGSSSAHLPNNHAQNSPEVNAPSRTRKDSIDSGISQETGASHQSQRAETSSSSVAREQPKTRKEKRTVTTTSTKISFSESKMRITEKVKRRSSAHPEETLSTTSSTSSSTKTIPEIKVTSPRGEEETEVLEKERDKSGDNSLTTPAASGVKTPSLKEMMSENGKQFQEHMDKMRKKLEYDLHRYKSQLESSL